MTVLRVAVLLCVFLIQRAASEGCTCRSEIYISIDDVIKALNNGPGIPGLIYNQKPCGCNQPSCSKQSFSNQLSFDNLQSCGCKKQPCGCNQQSQSIKFKQPLSIASSNQCGCQPSISFKPPQQCGCLPSVSSKPSRQCGCLPSVSFKPPQQCGCLPSVSFKPPQQCGCLPSVSFKPSQKCGCQQWMF